MISFALRCDLHSHGFDGWFRSGDDFERQAAAHLVTCPVCGTTGVSKALMRPAIGKGATVTRDGEHREAAADAASASDVSKPDGSDASSPTGAATPGNVVSGQTGIAGVASGPAAAMIAKLQSMTRELRASSDYVGPRFAEEARRIHFGETPHRSIYGEASKAEVEKLSDEGITAFPLPSLPEDAN